MNPYVPSALPVRDLDLARLLPKVGPANAALALRGLLNCAEGRQVL